MHLTLCVPRRETERIRCFGCFSFEQGALRSAADLLNEGRPRSPKLKVGVLFSTERWTSMSLLPVRLILLFFFLNFLSVGPEIGSSVQVRSFE